MFLTSNQSRYSPIKVGGMRIFETMDEVVEHCARSVIAEYNQRMKSGWNSHNLHLENMVNWDCPKVHEVFKDKPSKLVNHKKVLCPLVLAKTKEIQQANAI